MERLVANTVVLGRPHITKSYRKYQVRPTHSHADGPMMISPVSPPPVASSDSENRPQGSHVARELQRGISASERYAVTTGDAAASEAPSRPIGADHGHAHLSP
jgi:hypothetical protein